MIIITNYVIMLITHHKFTRESGSQEALFTNPNHLDIMKIIITVMLLAINGEIMYIYVDDIDHEVI